MNIKFKSNNKIIEVDKNKRFRLLGIDGIDSGNYEIMKSENLFADGSRVNDKKILSRNIMLEIEYTGKEKARERSNLSSFFNIHHSGIMVFKNEEIERKVEYEVEGFKAKLNNLYEPLRALISLYCPNPFWLDTETTSKEVVQWEGGMTFPLILPTTFATEGEKEFNLINDGDVEAPIKIQISGPATNPKILNASTDEYIKIKKKVELGETLVITTEFGNKRVEIDGVNAFSYIDLDSTFFQLQVGDNIIKLETEELNENSKIKIEYRNRYLGV